MKKRILFLCTHNSARSQMAQGLLNWLAPESYEAYSAGTHPSAILPFAQQVMAELGINILLQGTHQIADYIGQPFDLVVTVYDAAAEACPTFPNVREQLHWGFANPAAATGTDEERLSAFRHTRDLILVRLRTWLEGERALGPTLTKGTGQLLINPVSPLSPIPLTVVLLCAGNAARAHMAAGFLRYLGGSAYTITSAGTDASPIDPLAIAVMGERGIAIERPPVQLLTTVVQQACDTVITIYDAASEASPPVPSSVQTIHWNFANPATLQGTSAERMQAFRDVRDGLYFYLWHWISQHAA